MVNILSCSLQFIIMPFKAINVHTWLRVFCFSQSNIVLVTSQSGSYSSFFHDIDLQRTPLPCMWVYFCIVFSFSLWWLSLWYDQINILPNMWNKIRIAGILLCFLQKPPHTWPCKIGDTWDAMNWLVNPGLEMCLVTKRHNLTYP